MSLTSLYTCRVIVNYHPWSVVYSCSMRCRHYSKGFIQSLIEKVKEESSKDTELKENIRRFREETAKLEQTKELRSVREFYKKIEKEMPADTVDKVRGTFQSVKNKIRNDAQNLAQNETLRKGVESLSKAGEHVRDATKSLGETDFVKAAIKSVEVLEKELESDRSKMYQAPSILKTRSEISGKSEDRIMQPDSESSGVVVHKDSKWFTAWQDFKENNPYVQRFFDLKANYEESDHLIVRSLRFVTDKVSSLFGGFKSTNELQEVLDEVTKMDPSFNLESFIRYCRFVVIPNVLEAIVRVDLPILQDWCHEAPFNVLATPLRQIKELGYVSESRILDIHNVDVQMGKIMEQGPVLIITFQAQQIHCIRDKNGTVHEGDPNKVLRVTHVWALCRDQSEMHPLAAWRLLDIAMIPSEQWV
ncbi:Mitochondrial import inner membrane translocase subunit TIM44 isoform 1 [Schistosoma japonicum]|uniref:Mitochondrial import inner membrane translocase subunit TIM44 n=2 Tax=Schistosoma japonicum TaxID=6182 RepID=C1LFG2_SCHJA|nr:Mitochondrial import inner membrane translocase subunit TIM44 [Schistosoma japonicum]TNN05618.1 Mitochondrial import inner membrane translocase subunit TIM44 isoform 1 [Schistosoma japonicum]CAX73440.1 Import inner membrane translocase subunit TIM44, mitochondrial precursor [Schistosoma japonicum]